MSSRPRAPSSAHASRKRGHCAATAATASRRSSKGNATAACSADAAAGSGGGSSVSGGPDRLRLTGESLMDRHHTGGRLLPFAARGRRVDFVGVVVGAVAAGLGFLGAEHDRPGRVGGGRLGGVGAAAVGRKPEPSEP